MGNFLSPFLAWLARRSYWLARFRGLAHLRLSAWSRNKRTPIVIHQMGKVGSTSVWKSLREADPDLPVYQTHHLTPESVAREELTYRRSFPSLRRIDRHLLHSLYLLPRLQTKSCSGAWQVITLVRDPLARNVSAFFQTLPFRVPEFQEKVATTSEPELLAEIRHLYFSPDGWWHDDPISTFFNQQLQPVFGIDVFDVDFPKNRGYKIYRSESVELLVLRVEDLDRIASEAFEQFLGLEDVRLQRGQVANRKYYAEIYRRTRRELVFPRPYLDRIYGSLGARHFYSVDELRQFRTRWRSSADAV